MSVLDRQALAAILASILALGFSGGVLLAGAPGLAALLLGIIYLLFGFYAVFAQDAARRNGSAVTDERDQEIEGKAFRFAAQGGVVVLAVYVLTLLAANLDTPSVPIAMLAVGLVVQLLVAQLIWGLTVLVLSRRRSLLRAR